MLYSGIASTGAGATTVALLPNTSGFRPLLVVAIAVLAFGLVTLSIAGVSALKQARSSKA